MSELKEVWKDVEGYENKYQVSNLGRVRSFIGGKGSQRENPKILKPAKNTQGYLFVGLCKNCKTRYLRVHRLVAQAFISNPENKPQVNHINGIKTDNRVSNLEWSTRQENIQHAFKNKLFPLGENNPRAKLTNEQAKEIRNQYIPYSREFGTRTLAKKYGVSQNVIRKIINHKTYKNI